MDYKKLNEMLKDLNKLRNSSKMVEKPVVKDLNGREEQGESSEIYEIYPTDEKDIFIRLTINSDSYGDNEFVNGIEFVSPIQRQVTNYESVK